MNKIQWLRLLLGLLGQLGLLSQQKRWQSLGLLGVGRLRRLLELLGCFELLLGLPKMPRGLLLLLLGFALSPLGAGAGPGAKGR